MRVLTSVVSEDIIYCANRNTVLTFEVSRNIVRHVLSLQGPLACDRCTAITGLMRRGWNSHVHRGFPGKLESSNLSREVPSREIGRKHVVIQVLFYHLSFLVQQNSRKECSYNRAQLETSPI